MTDEKPKLRVIDTVDIYRPCEAAGQPVWYPDGKGGGTWGKTTGHEVSPTYDQMIESFRYFTRKLGHMQALRVGKWTIEYERPPVPLDCYSATHDDYDGPGDHARHLVERVEIGGGIHEQVEAIRILLDRIEAYERGEEY